ncbi:MAG: nitroreductase family protein [Dehalococcoidales bacterium]|nr:nitroreductase family protein [Dehalococcoidales bacterium]
MDVWDAIIKRRTIRVFTEPVPDQLLRRLIWAGSRAPSASNSQPWEFIIIQDRKTIDEIAEQKGAMEGLRGGRRRVAIEKNLYNNSSIVAICNRKGIFGGPGAWMAAENIALAATGEGIGCVMTIFGGEYKEVVEKLLDIPDTHELTTVMALGTPEEWPEKRAVGEDRPDFSWLHFNTFGNQAE